MLCYSIIKVDGQEVKYSKWVDSSNVVLCKNDLYVLNSDSSIFSVTIKLFGHTMILSKSKNNTYQGNCIDYFIQLKKNKYRTAYIIKPIPLDTVKILVDYFIHNQIDTLLNLEEIDLKHNYNPMIKDGVRYNLAIKASGKEKSLTFNCPERRNYSDNNLTKLVELQNLLIRYGNWENRQKKLQMLKFKKGCYKVDIITIWLVRTKNGS
jgi:hypothetical protein